MSLGPPHEQSGTPSAPFKCIHTTQATSGSSILINLTFFPAIDPLSFTHLVIYFLNPCAITFFILHVSTCAQNLPCLLRCACLIPSYKVTLNYRTRMNTYTFLFHSLHQHSYRQDPTLAVISRWLHTDIRFPSFPRLL